MAATFSSGVSLSTPRVLPKACEAPTIKSFSSSSSWPQRGNGSMRIGSGRVMIRPVKATPDLSGQVAESIKKAEEACADDATTGECAASWDEVEELSAAVSHAKDKKKGSDPLEEYCKENPETNECRTYED